jgi:hypothetical protein
MKHALAALLVLAACGGDPRSEIDGGGDGAGDDGAGDDGPGDDGPGDDGPGDDGPDDVAEYVSGTRIRRRMGTTPDGAKMFLGWRDIMRNEDCTFLPSTDGVSRCLPANYTLVSSFSYFSDSQCAVGLAIASAACPLGATVKYALKSQSTNCSVSYGILPITGTHTGPVYQGSPANCTAVTAPTPFTFHTLGPAISPSAFQPMTESVE